MSSVKSVNERRRMIGEERMDLESLCDVVVQYRKVNYNEGSCERLSTD